MRSTGLLLLLSACGTPPTAAPPTPGDVDDTGEPPVEIYDCTADQTLLRSGIDSIDVTGAGFSPFVVHGEQACPVIIDDAGHTMVASSRAGDGWVVSFGHEGILHGPEADTGLHTLLDNAVRFGGEAPVVGVSKGYSTSLVDWLTDDLSLSATRASADELDGLDVYVTDVYTAHSADELDALHAFVEGGGGLVVGGHAWYYGPDYAEPATEYPGNQLLNPLGLTVSVQYSAGGVHVLDEDTLPGTLHHHGHALSALADHVNGVEELEETELTTGSDTARFAASELPVTFSDWWDLARSFLAQVPAVVPTEEAPIVLAEQPVEALALALETVLALESPYDEVTEAAAASDFPGAVAQEATRGTITRTVDATWAGRDSDFVYAGATADLWLSTGAYAAPAEAVTLTVPDTWVDQGLELQIGAHADTLWSKEELWRAPELVRTDPVDTTQTTAASGFGGPVYLRVPAGTELGSGEITVAGALAMPRFVHGETDPADWEAWLDAAEVPWAEVETEHLIFTLPTHDLTELQVTDPSEVLDLWATVMDAQADLAGVSRDRSRPERMVLDRQISAGWMHSGYPIMGHLESTAELTHLDTLTWDGAWGPLHELGHNHQLDPLILPGTTEATCNLFSVHGSEEVLGISRNDAHPSLSPDSRADRIEEYLAGGANFSADWSVWVALETYLQLQEAFGWEPIMEVHAQFVEMPASERPSSDQARIDALVEATSLATERDLRDFYTAWGFPFSEDVADTVEHLPAWSDHPLTD